MQHVTHEQAAELMGHDEKWLKEREMAEGWGEWVREGVLLCERNMNWSIVIMAWRRVLQVRVKRFDEQKWNKRRNLIWKMNASE
jgi:hypothetical protein